MGWATIWAIISQTPLVTLTGIVGTVSFTSISHSEIAVIAYLVR
jgi:hypothetical protein